MLSENQTKLCNEWKLRKVKYNNVWFESWWNLFLYKDSARTWLVKFSRLIWLHVLIFSANLLKLIILIHTLVLWGLNKTCNDDLLNTKIENPSLRFYFIFCQPLTGYYLFLRCVIKLCWYNHELLKLILLYKDKHLVINNTLDYKVWY